MTKTKEPEAPDAKMAMWDRLMPTDPKYTKAFDRGGFKGTATNATYIVRKLTEEFGPCGAGWRFVLDDEQIIDGHTLHENGDKAKLHVVRGHLEYRQTGMNAIAVDDPWFATSPQFGQTMLVGRNKNGLFTDEEAPKKSITDCISKCAVLLGIAADVHLGLFDDNKYVNQRKQEEAAEAAEDPKAPPASPAAPQQAKSDAAPEKPSEDDLTIARQVFHLVKVTAEKATDEKDIDDCLKHNGASLKILAKYPANYDAVKAIVGEARERIKKLPKGNAADPALNDDMPSFEDMGKP